MFRLQHSITLGEGSNIRELLQQHKNSLQPGDYISICKENAYDAIQLLRDGLACKVDGQLFRNGKLIYTAPAQEKFHWIVTPDGDNIVIKIGNRFFKNGDKELYVPYEVDDECMDWGITPAGDLYHMIETKGKQQYYLNNTPINSSKYLIAFSSKGPITFEGNAYRLNGEILYQVDDPHEYDDAKESHNHRGIIIRANNKLLLLNGTHCLYEGEEEFEWIQVEKSPYVFIQERDNQIYCIKDEKKYPLPAACISNSLDPISNPYNDLGLLLAVDGEYRFYPFVN